MGATNNKLSRDKKLKCPTCNQKLSNELDLVRHFNEQHTVTGTGPTAAAMGPATATSGDVFKPGDQVMAMWEVEMWQYFPATIVKKVTDVTYEVKWDDGDTTGRLVNVGNLYLNVAPHSNAIKVGSQVLFRQGQYRAGQTQLTGGFRWHEGRITGIHQNPDGGFTYSGNHTKGVSDSKCVTYSGYDFKFYGYTVDGIRLSSSSSVCIDSVDNTLLSPPPYRDNARLSHDLNQKFFLEVNDRVIAEWKATGTYCSATVRQILPDSKYLLDWQDNDTTGREVRHYCINLDSIPRQEELKVDSVVYFLQCGQWHAGCITQIHQNIRGVFLYDGEPLSNRSAQPFLNYTIDKLCSKIDVNADGSLDTIHVGMATAATPLHNTGSLLNVGDRVLAMWIKTKWQYFPAKIVKVLPNLHYKIEWDDGDTTGLIVDCFKIAKDTIPDPDNIGVGTIVLFQQGGYSASASQLHGGVRWHQGIITNIRVDSTGAVVYDGCHTKGEVDGKWITYRYYSYQFFGMKLEELRVGPNMFDIVSHALPTSPPAYIANDSILQHPPPAYHPQPPMSNFPAGDNSQTLDIAPPAYSPPSLTEGDEVNRILKDIDPFVQIMETSLKDVSNAPVTNAEVFISYCWTNSQTAKDHVQVSHCIGNTFSDPRRVAKDIADDDVKVWLDMDCLSSPNALIQQHAEAIKNCRVFIPCISHQYSASTFCRMQFQFACGLPEKKIIPLITGDGDDWKSSVIGLAMERERDRFSAIDLQQLDSEDAYAKCLNEIVSRIRS